MLDLERISKNLQDIFREVDEIEKVFLRKDIEKILENSLVLKAFKYSVIAINEAIANTLQHILAKHFSVSISGYAECLEKAFLYQIISEDLFKSLSPFVRFRNMLVHRYWIVNDEIFLRNLKEGLEDFRKFQLEIREWLKKHNYL